MVVVEEGKEEVRERKEEREEMIWYKIHYKNMY